MIPPTQVSRLRNAAATREAILASARRHFARESYDNVGLREIAGDAGVDPALVGRYFGNKEQLFKEALRKDDQPAIAGIARDELPEYFASLLTSDKATDCAVTAAKIDHLLMLLRSASSPKASEIIRQAVDEDMLGPVAAVIGGEDAEVRASLCLSVLMGAGILRSAMALDPLCTNDGNRLHARLVNLFAAALE